jgi:ABC-type nitrate/sulfonate/bicarbonate transport system permease component
MSSRRGLIALEIVTPVLLLLAWWLLSAGSHSFYFPPLSKIVTSFRETWLSDQLWTDGWPSIKRFLAGYLIAIVVGVAGGVALGRSQLLRAALTPVLDYFRSIPVVALIPFAIVVLGVGDSAKIFVIFMGAVWPVLLNTMDATASVDDELLATARAFHLRRRDLIFRVVLPSASPQIFAGMRTSMAIGLILMVTSEMVGATNGIGYSVVQAQRLFAIPKMWAGIILLGIIGYVMNLLFLRLEARALRWHRGSHAGVGG